MKKLLLITFIASMTCGCTRVEGTASQTSPTYGDGCGGWISSIEYNNHQYIIWKHGYSGGICHDENCKCKNDTI